MKNNRIVVFLLICSIIISCTTNDNHQFDFKEGKLQVIDSVIIDDSNFSFGEVYNPRLFNDTIIGFGDGTFRSINLFHAKSGVFLTTYETDSISSYILPIKDMSLFHIQGNYIYILNNLVKSIFVFDLKKNFIQKINLSFNDDFHKPTFEGLFEINGNYIYLSSVYDGTLRDRFKNSKIVTQFNLKGSFINNFGSYPKPYTEGNLVLSANENKLIKNGKIYLLNVAGVPILKEYLLNGDINETFNLASMYHDPEIGFYTDSPFNAPLTDQFNGLASDQNSSQKVFYATYHSFDTRDRDYGLETYRWMLMKINLEDMTIKETELADAWYLHENPKLIPQMKGDTLSFLIREKNENLYMKRVVFD